MKAQKLKELREQIRAEVKAELKAESRARSDELSGPCFDSKTGERYPGHEYQREERDHPTFKGSKQDRMICFQCENVLYEWMSFLPKDERAEKAAR